MTSRYPHTTPNIFNATLIVLFRCWRLPRLLLSIWTRRGRRWKRQSSPCSARVPIPVSLCVNDALHCPLSNESYFRMPKTLCRSCDRCIPLAAMSSEKRPTSISNYRPCSSCQPRLSRDARRLWPSHLQTRQHLRETDRRSGGLRRRAPSSDLYIRVDDRNVDIRVLPSRPCRGEFRLTLLCHHHSEDILLGTGKMGTNVVLCYGLLVELALNNEETALKLGEYRLKQNGQQGGPVKIVE